MSNIKPREIAIQLLVSSDESADFVEENLDKSLNSNDIKIVDRRLIQELIFGVIRWRGVLDFLIDRKVARKMPHRIVRWVLRLGLYQLFWLDRIPDHAIVNESVSLVAHLGYPQHKGFVNALLRNYIRERDGTRTLLMNLKSQNPFLGYSHPQWLCEKWESVWGRDAMVRLLEWNNTIPKVFARINQLVIPVSEMLNRWDHEEIQYRKYQQEWFSEHSIYELLAFPRLTQLASFHDGCFYIQDPSTLLSVTQLDPRPGDTILDFCASPGGKTAMIAERMKNQGVIFAHDALSHRLTKLHENLKRMKITCAQVISNQSELKQMHFDRILLDVPCSNTGVMRRRVELRWRIQSDEILRLASIQRELLEKAAPLLKPNGVLVYSTCSLEKEENSLVVTSFLRDHPEFRLQFERQLLPFVDEVDGAYVVKMQKIVSG